MIADFHSHILPGIDDGSSSLEESLGLLRMEAEQGITRVVATPHFYPQRDTPERFLKRRAEAEAALREKMTEEHGLPRLSIGAEVFYFRGMGNSEVLSELTIDSGNCILVEMAGVPWSNGVYRDLEDLYVKRGVMPIIAHVDRYIAPFRTYGIPAHLAELPVLVQANASFFLNRFTSGMALRMLKHKKIHLLGSDCHNLTNRPPRLGEAYQQIVRHLGEEAISYLRWQGNLVFGEDA